MFLIYLHVKNSSCHYSDVKHSYICIALLSQHIHTSTTSSVLPTAQVRTRIPQLHKTATRHSTTQFRDGHTGAATVAALIPHLLGKLETTSTKGRHPRCIYRYNIGQSVLFVLTHVSVVLPPPLLLLLLQQQQQQQRDGRRKRKEGFLHNGYLTYPALYI
jgi:hypothetical protein